MQKSYIILMFVLIWWKTSFPQFNQKSFDSLLVIVENSSDFKKAKALNKISALLQKHDENLRIQYAKSALKIALNIKKPDVVIESYYQIGKSYHNKLNFDSAIVFYNQAFDHFTNSKDKILKSKVFTACALSYERLYQFNPATEYHSKALEINQILKDTSEIAYSLTCIGLNYWRTGNYKEAEKYYNDALSLRKIINDKRAISVTLNNLGVLHWNWGNYSKALKFYFEAFELKDEAKDSNGLVLSFNNIGMLYQKFGDIESARQNYLKGLEIANKINYLFGIAYSNENIGNYFLEQELFNEADAYYTKALDIYLKIYHKGGLSNVYNNFGVLYYKLKNYKKSLDYHLKAYQISIEASDRKAVVISLNYLGRVSNQLGDIETAKTYLFKSLDYLDKDRLLDYLKDTYGYLSESFEKEGNITQSFHYLKLYRLTSDSLYTAENLRIINDLKEKYEADRKDRENEKLRNQTVLQRYELNRQTYVQNFTIAVVALLLIIVSFLIYQNRQKKKKNLEIFLAKSEAEKLNLELNEINRQILESEKKLKEINATKDKFFSIIAHDLRNPFLSILGFLDLLTSNFSSFNDNEKIQMLSDTNTTALNAFKLLENLLQWSRLQTEGIVFRPQNLNFSKLLKHNVDDLKNVCILKNINIEIPEHTDIDFIGDEDMLNSIIRNIISNSIKFTPVGGNITISYVKQEKNLMLTITDSGIGMEQSLIDSLFKVDSITSRKGTQGEKGTGIGLLLVSEFVAKHHGIINVKSEIGKGTSFILTFPIIENSI